MLSLSEKLGYEVRCVNGVEYYVVDISFPAILTYTRAVYQKYSAAGREGEIQGISSFLACFDGQDVKAAWHETIPLYELKQLVRQHVLPIFDTSELSLNDQRGFIEILFQLSSNYTGFQRLMSLAALSLLNELPEGFYRYFSKLNVLKTREENGGFSHAKRAVELREYVFDASYESQRISLHVLSYVVHRMMCPQNLLNGCTPFFVSSVLGCGDRSNGDARINNHFAEMFFPAICGNRLDPRANSCLGKILMAINNHSSEFNKLKSDIEEITRNPDLCRQNGCKTASDTWCMLIHMVQLGLGRAIFGPNWQRSIAKMLTPETFAKAIYVRVMLCWIGSGCFSERFEQRPISTEIDIRRINPEGALAIFGMVMFNFKGKVVILEDRNCELNYSRRSQPGETEEQFHALRRFDPSVDVLNSSIHT